MACQQVPLQNAQVTARWPAARLWQGRCTRDKQCHSTEAELVVLEPRPGELQLYHRECWSLQQQELQRLWREIGGVPSDPLALELVQRWWDRQPRLQVWARRPECFRLRVSGRPEELHAPPALRKLADGLWQVVRSVSGQGAPAWLQGAQRKSFLADGQPWQSYANLSEREFVGEVALSELSPFAPDPSLEQQLARVSVEVEPRSNCTTLYVNCVPLSHLRPWHLRVAGPHAQCATLQLASAQECFFPVWPTQADLQLLPPGTRVTYSVLTQ